MALPLEKALYLALLERTWALCVLLGRANTGPLYHFSGTGGSSVVYLGDKLASGLGRTPGWIPGWLGKF